MASTAPTAQAPAKKKRSPWIWIAAGCGTIIVLGLIVAAVLTLWVGRKVKNFADEAQKNPAIAAAKLIVAANPDLEFVSQDDSAGTITVRNKKTGETITMDAKEIQEGRVTFTNEKGEEVTFEGGDQQGEGGTMKVTSKEGEMTIGAGSEAKIPAWVPAYEGATTEGTYSATNEEGDSGGFSFKTADSPEKVLESYSTRLKSGGFEVSTSKFEENGVVSGGMVQGTADAGARTVSVTVSAEESGGATAALIFTEKRQ